MLFIVDFVVVDAFDEFHQILNIDISDAMLLKFNYYF